MFQILVAVSSWTLSFPLKWMKIIKFDKLLLDDLKLFFNFQGWLFNLRFYRGKTYYISVYMSAIIVKCKHALGTNLNVSFL